jgi:hypothetical protein
MHWPRGDIILTIRAILIPILILLIYLSSRNKQENESLMNDLLTIIVSLSNTKFAWNQSEKHHKSKIENPQN